MRPRTLPSGDGCCQSITRTRKPGSALLQRTDRGDAAQPVRPSTHKDGGSGIRDDELDGWRTIVAIDEWTVRPRRCLRSPLELRRSAQAISRTGCQGHPQHHAEATGRPGLPLERFDTIHEIEGDSQDFAVLLIRQRYGRECVRHLDECRPEGRRRAVEDRLSLWSWRCRFARPRGESDEQTLLGIGEGVVERDGLCRRRHAGCHRDHNREQQQADRECGANQGAITQR
jgi:hypothetical protein